jgi:hypothetical protein
MIQEQMIHVSQYVLSVLFVLADLRMMQLNIMKVMVNLDLGHIIRLILIG